MAKSQPKRSGCLTCLGVLVLIPILILILAFGSKDDGVRDEADRRDGIAANPVARPDAVAVKKQSDEEIATSAIPGIKPADVYQIFTAKGFDLDENFTPAFFDSGVRFSEQWTWTCNEQTAAYDKMVEVFAEESPDRVTLVRATYTSTTRVPSIDGGKQFFGLVASIRYEGAEPARARPWVLGRLGSIKVGESLVMSIGPAKFELHHAVPRNWTLMIQASD